MLECRCEEFYKQDNPTEPIKVGDIISLDPNTNKVKRAFNKGKHSQTNKGIGNILYKLQTRDTGAAYIC